MFVDLQYNFMLLYSSVISICLSMLCNIKLPHTDFNKSRTMFQAVLGGTDLWLSEKSWYELDEIYHFWYWLSSGPFWTSSTVDEALLAKTYITHNWQWSALGVKGLIKILKPAYPNQIRSLFSIDIKRCLALHDIYKNVHISHAKNSKLRAKHTGFGNNRSLVGTTLMKFSMEFAHSDRYMMFTILSEKRRNWACLQSAIVMVTMLIPKYQKYQIIVWDPLWLFSKACQPTAIAGIDILFRYSAM